MPLSTANIFFLGKKSDKVPRFDKIIEEASYQLDQAKRSKSTRIRPALPQASIEEFLEKNKNVGGPPVDVKKMARDFMRGQPYNITEYCELK